VEEKGAILPFSTMTFWWSWRWAEDAEALQGSTPAQHAHTARWVVRGHLQKSSIQIPT